MLINAELMPRYQKKIIPFSQRKKKKSKIISTKYENEGA